jgi:hypothetical protein
METEILNSVVTAVTPLIQSIVDVYVKPKLEVLRDNDGEKKLPTAENFTEYFHRTFKKLVVMNTLVFHNSQRLLTDIYVPLSISTTNVSKMKKAKVDNFPKEISNEFHNILITDTAGMGKSTMMKKIFISAIYEGNGIPLFIELRRLNKGKKLLDEIQEQLNALEKNFNSQLLLELLIQGDFIIILDGYDEITLSDKEIVTTDIQDFISKASNNRFFITSRPENALSCFGNFQEFKIEPLTKSEAYMLLRKYDSQGKVSSLLIDKLKEKGMENIGEFLTNPLLVSLLFLAFEHKQIIPLKKYLFYRQVFDANFESHDLTKGDSYIHDKYSGLSIDDFHKVLRHIGFNCFKQQKIEFSKDEVLKLIEQSKTFCIGLVFNESDFLTDLLKTVPLFTQDGNYYRWAHKSLHEYFAAQFIYIDAKEKQNDILLGIYNSLQLSKFINVLDLYYDMDYKTFRNVIEYNLLKDYCEYSSKSYNKKYDGVSEKDIVERKELMFNFIDCNLMKSILIDETQLDGKDLLEYLENLIPRSPSYLRSITQNSLGYTVCDYHNKYPIIKLLFYKQNSIIQRNNRFFNVDELKEIDAILAPILSDNKPIKITDSIDNILNDCIRFKLIAKHLLFISKDECCVNHSVALKRYEEIKTSMEAEKKDDLLNGF